MLGKGSRKKKTDVGRTWLEKKEYNDGTGRKKIVRQTTP